MIKFSPSKLRLASSVTVGAAAFFMVWFYVKNSERNFEARTQMTTVLRARKFIPKDRAITPENVEEILIPGAYAPPAVLQTKADLQGAGGRARYKARSGIAKGDYLTRSRLTDENTALGLAWNLASGQTAAGFRFPVEHAAGGHVQPGDWAHVFFTAAGERPHTTMILSRVQVIAVQERLWDPAGGDSTPLKDMPNDSILVTLSLTPRQAALAALALERGKLSLVVASPLDAQGPSPVHVEVSSLKIGPS